MNNKELLNWCEHELRHKSYLEFNNEIFLSLSEEQAILLAENYGGSTLMMLPQREILFFEWLKNEDYEIWKDLWDNSQEVPYLVGMSFLPILLDESRGFPICDLLNNDNYYFKKDFMINEESTIFLESVQERFLAHEPLTIAQLLTLEISIAPIDIWHFAYFRSLDLKASKRAVEQLVDDKIIIHIKEAAHLASFIDF